MSRSEDRKIQADAPPAGSSLNGYFKAMEKGERDPARLCTVGLAALGPVIVDAPRPGDYPRLW
jgi:hypothetical protein